MSETAKGNMPWDEFRDGKLKLATWKNEGDTGPYFQSKLRNAFKDKDSGDFVETDYLSETDLLKLIHLATEAYHAIRADKRANAKARREKKAETAAA
jgi:hypothetical protein